MKSKTKIAIGVGVGIALITTAIIFRKQIRKVVLGATKFNAELAKLALKEWDTWSNGSVKEGSSKTMASLRMYWRDGAGVNWSDEKMINEAWSAAFISWVMKKGGAGKDFVYSTSHSKYIVAAIQNQKSGNSNPFKGHKPEDVKVEKGDLVCFARQSGVGYDSTGRYKSHCDLVIDVDKEKARTIGGNISNSVSLTNVKLTKDGKIDLGKEKKYFVVIKNNK